MTLRGKQLMVRSKGQSSRTDYRCSPNKAFIARMCVNDPKESRVTTVPAAPEVSSQRMYAGLIRSLCTTVEVKDAPKEP